MIAFILTLMVHIWWYFGWGKEEYLKALSFSDALLSTLMWISICNGIFWLWAFINNFTYL